MHKPHNVNDLLLASIALKRMCRYGGGVSLPNTAVLLSLLLPSLIVQPLRAEIIADPNAPGQQQPTVLQTSNGLPLVNIQTPSVAGVSHNTYQQFDVDARGARSTQKQLNHRNIDGF